MSAEPTGWRARLEELARAHGVPGAVLGVLAAGKVSVVATGVLNRETGVETTPDSLFQLGSITKVYTATALMRLVDDGKLDLDAPVVEVLPEFRVADDRVSRSVTARHLLSHTSGIAGDCFEDTGRGDDALERYVERCATLGQDVPLGATMSYCNTGYCVLGRMIERLTGQVFDTALEQLLLEPAGLTSTVTLPEQALRFRTAWGHVAEPGEELESAPYWDDPRALGPAGSVCASAADLLTFARLHLADGVASDGGRVLSTAAVAEMQRPQVAIADRWVTADHWGLGWALHDWDGERLFSHDGNTIGQNAYLTVAPAHGVAIALLTNIGNALQLARELTRELLSELCAIEVPAWPEPASQPVGGEEQILGCYRRYGVELEVVRDNGALQAITRVVEPLASQLPEDTPERAVAMSPSSQGEGVYLARLDETEMWWPMVFFDLDGERYLHFGARAQRRWANG